MSIPTIKDIEQLVNGMEGVSLDEMDHVKLMRRKDTKYVLSYSKLPAILQQVKAKYKVLEIKGYRIHPYKTLYYDTPLLEMYHHHHNKRLNRYKVRVRNYELSNMTFLEVKFKSNKGETIKKRISPMQPSTIAGSDCVKFLQQHTPYTSTDIVPALQNSFSRITLVHKTMPERITIDFGLRFVNASNAKEVRISKVAIIEVKRDLDAGFSDMVTLLRDNRIFNMGFSKYCIGTAMINEKVRKNLFKARMRKLAKFESGMG